MLSLMRPHAKGLAMVSQVQLQDIRKLNYDTTIDTTDQGLLYHSGLTEPTFWCVKSGSTMLAPTLAEASLHWCFACPVLVQKETAVCAQYVSSSRTTLG